MDESSKAESEEMRIHREAGDFIRLFSAKQAEVHATAKEKGWWDSSKAVKKIRAEIDAHMPYGSHKIIMQEALEELDTRKDGEMI